MSANPADSSARSLFENFDGAMRSRLNNLVLEALPPIDAATRTLLAPENDLPRRAALYALENFRALTEESRDPASSDAAVAGISEKALYNRLRWGHHSSADIRLLSHLHKQIAKIGHVIGEKKSTSHVAAGAFAMPITFTSPLYAIDAVDLVRVICATAGAA